MFGNNHGFSFKGNSLVHNGTTPSGMSSGQSIMFKYFNEVLVNSETKTTVLANQRSSLMSKGMGAPTLNTVSSSAAATTFGTTSGKETVNAGGMAIDVSFAGQNQILVPTETMNKGTSLMTAGGSKKVGSDHVLTHEFGHAIVNTIMNELGGEFNGVDFNSMTNDERSDWAIRFTNTLFSGNNLETGEGQHGRGSSTRPTHTLAPLKQ